MQVSDAHLHRRNRRRSASVTRSSATPPRRASSSSSSDTADAGAAADGDYELEERSAGNTPRRRSATGSRAISPAAPRKHTPRKSKSPASPSSSRASKQGDSDDSSGELSSALCLSDSNREQLATPAGKQAGSKRKRASSTRYTSNKELPSWTSDQPTGVLRAPAKPMDQPQLAAPSAEPALKMIHGDNDWKCSHVHAHRVSACLACKLSADGASAEILHGEGQRASEEKMFCECAKDNCRGL